MNDFVCAKINILINLFKLLININDFINIFICNFALLGRNYFAKLICISTKACIMLIMKIFKSMHSRHILRKV